MADAPEPQERRGGLTGFARRNAQLLALATFALAAFGVWSLLHLASGIYPEVDFPRIVVVAHAGDAPADLTVATVTGPLEAALATVPFVTKVRSTTIRGSSQVDLTFVPGTDMIASLAQVDARANEVRATLPPGSVLVAERLTPVAFPVATFNLAGPIDPSDLHDLGEMVVRPALSRVPGVGGVDVLGGDLREVEVEVDVNRAGALRLDVPKVADVIARTSVRATSGLLVAGGSAVTVEAASQATTAIELARAPIEVVAGVPVPLADVASVHLGAADRTSDVSGPSGDTVMISVARREGASTPTVVQAASDAIEALRPSLPKGVTLTPVYDQGVLIRDALASIRDAILLGIVLSVGVLGLLLRDVRAGLVAGAAVPLTLVLTFGAMYLLGQTLDLMSLGGMAVAIGLVVDDAIVIVEAIAKYREEGLSSEEAAERGTDELLWAVVGTTATTIVVFLPLGLLSGVVGRFFQALAITLASAVFLSMVVALLLVPLVAARLPRRPKKEGPNRLAGTYARLLRRSLRHRGILLVAALGLVALGVLAEQNVETGFLPTMDEGGFVIDYFLPAGTSLPDTAAAASKIEALLAADPAVAAWTRRTGVELGPAAATQVNTGDILVRLVPPSSRSRSTLEVIEALRPKVDEAAPEARTEFIQVMQDVLNDLAGAPNPIEVKLFGPDPRQLETLAREIAPKIEAIDGITDFYGGVEDPSPSLRFDVDAGAAGRLGLSAADVTTLLDATVRGRLAASMPYEDRLLDVRVRAPDEVRFDPRRLASLPLVPTVPTIPVTTLQAVARAEQVPGATVLEREDLRPVVTISGQQEGRDLGSIIADVKAATADVALPPGVTLELGGTYAEQQATFADLLRVLTLAVFAVALVLVAQFRSIRLAVVVLVTAPVAIVGALLALWIFGVPLDVSSLMGLVLLIGLVVKNGVLLLEHAQKREAAGVPRHEAIVEAGERRIRPILLTTLCTLFGLLPLALGIGQGTELQRPLAITVIGGLSLSTLVSLFLVPALAAGRPTAISRATP